MLKLCYLLIAQPNGLEILKRNTFELRFNEIQKEKFIVIYKVLFQENKQDNPRREYTHSIYIDADTSVDVREQVEKNTNYDIELIQELDEKHLEYEQQNPNFKLTEF